MRHAGEQADMPVFLAWAVSGLLRKKLQEASPNPATLQPMADLVQHFRAEAGLPQIKMEGLLAGCASGLPRFSGKAAEFA